MEQRAPLQSIIWHRGASPIVANRGELVEVAGEDEFHPGPVELGDLVQEPDVHLTHFVDPQDIARI
jgi:hypothetical protein